MSDEDRKIAIDMYNELFDEAFNERDLIQYLISPTKQAVLVAHAYNIVNTEPQKVSAEGEEPEFVKHIEALGNEYLNNVETIPPQEDIFAVSPAAVPEVPESEEPAPAAAPEEAEEPAAEEEPAQDIPEEEPAAEEPAPEAEEIPEELPAQEEAPAAREEPAADAPAAEKPMEDSEVDAFLEEYRSPVDEQPAPEEAPAPAQEEPAGESEAKPEEVPAQSLPEKQPAPVKPSAPEKPPVIRKEKKLNIFLLILYLIPALPIGLTGILLLIIPTVLFLSVSAVLICAGVYVVSAALAGFAVIADLFVVTGLAVILLALGLLFLWLFIWSIGGVMVGLIKGLVSLGEKICVREVRVNG